MSLFNHEKGLVLEIQRMSTEDGPGIRTTVFMKGCPLRCEWCHNPESISPEPQIQWIESRCIGCRTCGDVCPNGALEFSDSGVRINRRLCVGCGTCADECPSTALEIWGRYWFVNDLVREVAKDRVYFEQSGGGVTVSGGEATMQADFIENFLKGCRGEGLAVALDTCGLCSRNTLERLLPLVDMILFDLKMIDPNQHRRYTGVTNEQILENAIFAGNWMKNNLTPRYMWIRTPIIPGATDSGENIKGIGKFIAENLKGAVDRWELCAFNNLCRDKYLRLGTDWVYGDCRLATAEKMEEIASWARETGVSPEIVNWSGSTRAAEKHDFDAGEGNRLKIV